VSESRSHSFTEFSGSLEGLARYPSNSRDFGTFIISVFQEQPISFNLLLLLLRQTLSSAFVTSRVSEYPFFGYLKAIMAPLRM
jgi:hypothetical protein